MLQSDLFDLYDGIIVMAHLLHSVEFREVSMLQRVNMVKKLSNQSKINVTVTGLQF